MRPNNPLAKKYSLLCKQSMCIPTLIRRFNLKTLNYTLEAIVQVIIYLYQRKTYHNIKGINFCQVIFEFKHTNYESVQMYELYKEIF